MVLYDDLTENDPYWGDGMTREPWKSVAKRAGKLMEWIEKRDETRIVLAAHSGLLASLFVAVLQQPDGWFRTGEMRTMKIRFYNE